MKKRLELFKTTIQDYYFLIDFDFWSTVCYIEVNVGYVNVYSYEGGFLSLSDTELDKVMDRLTQNDIEIPDLPKE